MYKNWIALAGNSMPNYNAFVNVEIMIPPCVNTM